MELVGKILIIIALIFIVFGIFGLFRFRDFYSRILITSKVEVLGAITILAGIAIYSGFQPFTLKVLLIMIVLVITNPLATHSIARSAYKSGYKKKQKGAKIWLNKSVSS